MKITLKKRSGIETYDVLFNGQDTKYSVSGQNYLTEKYYLIYYGKRFSGRFNSLREVNEYLAGKMLDGIADGILGGK